MKRFVFFIFCLSGCVGTDVGNPETDADLDLTFSIDIDTQTQIHALERDGIHLTKATLLLESVELRKDCEATEAIVSQGPFTIDLLEDTTITLQDAGPGVYCRASFRFKNQTNVLAPWLVVEGNIAEDQTFRIEGVRAETLTMNGNSNLVIDAEGTSIHLKFDLFAALTELDGDYEWPLLINEEANVPIYNTIRQELRKSARLFKDNNRNRVVDTDERTPIGSPSP